mgnify:FL=1
MMNFVHGFRVTKTDGQTIFHHVPIFAECARGDLAFDGEWVASAIESAKQQERDGYFPPLHIRHHEPDTAQTDAVRSAGVFRITDASPISFKGKRIIAVFADLIVTDEFIADELCRMKYPYRSVEIFDPEGPPKINSLALLDHEAPYLELPMLFAGEVEDKRSPSPDGSVACANSFSINYASDSPNPMLGSARSGTRACLLFKFSDEDVMETKTKKTPATKAKPKASANFADDSEKKDEEKMEGAEGGGLDVAAVVAAIESGEISVADMDAILLAIQSQEAAVEEEDEEPAAAPAPGAEIMKKGGKESLNFARLSGEVEVLKASIKARDVQDKRREDVAAAMKQLEGKPLGSDLEQRLVKFHKTAGGNAELFKEYVDTMERMAGDIPTDSSGAAFAAQPKTPKSAMAFQALGGEAVDKAAGFARQWHELKTKGNIKASEESYIRFNMRSLGFVLEETATA